MSKKASAAEKFFLASLAKVESSSIREWAQTAQNRPIFVKLAASAMTHDGPLSGTPEGFAARIVALAIGL